ncbi:MAG: ISL3 family transposase, partial [Patescibacteria group bacterium]
MLLKTILNRVQKFKSFVYGTARWVEGASIPTIEVEIKPRFNSQPICSGCGLKGPGYDRLPKRRFEFVPFWGHKVFFVYAPRRVDCPCCSVRVEAMPWSNGKHRLTGCLSWFLARWAKLLSWKEVAEAFHTSWDHVFSSVEMAVSWGRSHRDLSNITAIGIDEIQWQLGHHYLTLVYQIDSHCKRLLWIGKERKVRTLLLFFRWFGGERTKVLQFICSDMWKPYLKVIAKKAGEAIHVLDRFHIMSHMNKAIDKVRAEEVRALQSEGKVPLLTRTRWLLLKRPENLSLKQETHLSDLLRY